MLERINKLRHKFDDCGLDGMLIGHAPNRRYMSGFTGSAGWLLISKRQAVIAVDFRYVEQAKQQAGAYDCLFIKGDISEWLPSLVENAGINKLGVESDFLSHSLHRTVCRSIQEKKPAIQVIPVQNLIESIRIYKDPSELECITRACQIVDEAVAYAYRHLRAGVSEKQFAWQLESFMRQNESEAMPFEIIVASGVNAALPHAQPTDKLIMEGEPVTIDMGARYKGYCSDVTRTFIIGKQDNEFNKIYNIVLGAQIAGLMLIKPDMNASEADGLVRAMIDNAGYGEKFGHGLGHGIGIETHEMPRLGTRSNDKLEKGMVFTVEPGIYLPGWGGVRIEDTVTIKDGKIESLTKSDKKALIYGG